MCTIGSTTLRCKHCWKLFTSPASLLSCCSCHVGWCSLANCDCCHGRRHSSTVMTPPLGHQRDWHGSFGGSRWRRMMWWWCFESPLFFQCCQFSILIIGSYWRRVIQILSGWKNITKICLSNPSPLNVGINTSDWKTSKSIPNSACVGTCVSIVGYVGRALPPSHDIDHQPWYEPCPMSPIRMETMATMGKIHRFH